ncbi:phenylalanine--tRNA ligase subunit beta [Candidatus Gottesmanbacteria bacterium]|nr:phenylalanine--tRNA ligase subunit beta [Candidatus Gottesmanbacteria bacterium]
MNLLIPDSWLREFLKTKATPKQMKEYLSLCGPSVEHIHVVNGEPVYDIEITTNRPDAMSVVGVAREAAAILPRFGIQAKLIGDPYHSNASKQGSTLRSKKLAITTDSKLNPRFTAMVFEHVKVSPSPAWLVRKLEQTGIRSINTVVDITNYLMRTYGQPAHVFDYDTIRTKNGIPTMILRASKKGETITTLDGKTHTLPGDDIVIEDGGGRIIDLCGIMGGENSRVRNTTTNVILFLQTYDPTHIRRTSMALSHRTEAAGLFEKGLDSELVLPVFVKGKELMRELTAAKPASRLYDIYPKRYKPYTVWCSRQKIDAYLGIKLDNREIRTILERLGFAVKRSKTEVTVTVPSFRQDVTIDVDSIEEIARMFGYHNIGAKLPEGELSQASSPPELAWEEEVKNRLRDWGFTETYTYSMISEKLMDAYALNKQKAYNITNPLSEEWVYMRPSLLPSMLATIEQNLHVRPSLKLFELAITYAYQEGDLPKETPVLIIGMTGQAFFELKGIAQVLFDLFGIPFPKSENAPEAGYYDPNRSLVLGDYGTVGELAGRSITVLELDFAKLVRNAKRGKSYRPIPKYPPVVEDLSFIVPAGTHIGPMMDAMRAVSTLIHTITLLDMYENNRTFHITYLDPKRNLTNENIVPIREKIVTLMEEAFGATVRALG